MRTALSITSSWFRTELGLKSGEEEAAAPSCTRDAAFGFGNVGESLLSESLLSLISGGLLKALYISLSC